MEVGHLCRGGVHSQRLLDALRVTGRQKNGRRLMRRGFNVRPRQSPLAQTVAALWVQMFE
jgi:hypothetical protein